MNFKLTQEQVDIIDAIVNRREKLIIVDSGAGASKSTTTMHSLYHDEIKYKNGLMLSFGKAIAEENAKHIPKWMQSKTIHALAYFHIVPKDSKLSEVNIDEFVELKSIGQKKFAKYLIDRFCSSSFVSIKDFIKNEEKERKKDLNNFVKPILNLIKKRVSEDRYFHGLYIKMFHLKLHQKALKIETDILVVDEFADCSGVLYEVAMLINAKKKILIGDCVDENTKIETENGWMTIKNMYKKYIDGKTFKVKSLNESTGKFEYKPVANIVKTGYKEMFNVVMNKNRIVTTKDHRFLTDKGYKRLYEIKAGDLIRSSVHSNLSSETYFVVEEITPAGTSMAYDMEVEDNHNFVASKTSIKKDIASGIVVHNCNQAIFGFSGSINGLQKAMKESEPAETIVLNLTKTFRCSTEIADGVKNFMRKYSENPDFSFTGHNHDEVKYEVFAYQVRSNGELIEVLSKVKEMGLVPSLTRSLRSIFSKYLAVTSFSKKMEIEGTPDDEQLFDIEYNTLYKAYKSASESASINNTKILVEIAERINPKSEKYDKDLEEEYVFIKTVLLTGVQKILDIYGYCKESKKVQQKDLIVTTVHSYKGNTSDVTFISDGISKKTLGEYQYNQDVDIMNRRAPKNQWKKKKYDECMCAYVAMTRARHLVINANEILNVPSCADLTEDDFFNMVLANKKDLKNEH